jgi:hypothetical protein
MGVTTGLLHASNIFLAHTVCVTAATRAIVLIVSIAFSYSRNVFEVNVELLVVA